MKRLLMGLIGALVLAGCGHSPEGSGANGPAYSASQGTGEAQTQPPASSSQGSKADLSTPLSDYIKSDDPSWLTYVYVSRLANQPSDDEKMKLFSPKYFNESDAFKKHDIMVSDLPTVNATLAKYREENYFTLQTDSPFGMFALVKPYDFGSQSFAINDCGRYAFHGNQNIYVKITSTDSMCNIKVTDTNLAHTVESMRANFHLKLMFTYYLFVDGLDPLKNQLNATATHLHIDFQDLQQNNKTVASIDID
jgi:hypothetical protein